jgi:hypothetical protein
MDGEGTKATLQGTNTHRGSFPGYRTLVSFFLLYIIITCCIVNPLGLS